MVVPCNTRHTGGTGNFTELWNIAIDIVDVPIDNGGYGMTNRCCVMGVVILGLCSLLFVIGVKSLGAPI